MKFNINIFKKIKDYMASKSKYVGKDFVFINGDFKGQNTRCTGTFRSENDGILYLELNNGMPVPVDQADFYLQEAKARDIVSDTIDLDDWKNSSEFKDEFSESKPQAKSERIVNQFSDSFSEAKPQPKKNETVPDMFGGFSKTPIDLNLKLNVELPDISLIRVMYNNYGNKEEFISNFSAHILASINKDVVSSAVISLLESSDKPKRTRKNNSPEN